MGDEVAPRKDFITNNALDVTNLDIQYFDESIHSFQDKREP